MIDAARPWLLAAAVFSVVASALHFACIVVGASLYRATGAGERMARMVEQGRTLPLMKAALVVISAVLFARGLGYPIMRLWRPDLSLSFLIWSSLICTVYGLCFAVGTWKVWPALSKGLN